MKRNTAIKQKAAFLLMVFVLNTIVGFACSLGVNMRFNTKHHDEDNAGEAGVYKHYDGQKHLHREKKETHGYDKGHGHDAAAHMQKGDNDEGNCCTGKVTKFQQLDKVVPPSIIVIHPIFFTALLASFYSFNIFPHNDVVKNRNPFVPSYHPPITDIRIAIRSFQI